MASTSPPSVDLHGLPPAQAMRRLAQALHAARVQGREEILVITGRGWGNREQKPILRRQVGEWLRGPEGSRLGVTSVRVTSRGGALAVRLA
ncbi:MAG: Smr/MutS family protein [Planctomycetota bacterium]